MRKLAIVLAATTVMVFAGALAWKADATTLTGVGGLPTVTKSYSPIENVRCVCGPRGCACHRRVWRCWWHRGRRVCGWR
jgi:hypothetical protein